VRWTVFAAVGFLHVPLLWDHLLWFYPAFFMLDALAPIALVAVGVDAHIAFLATSTALVGLYGLTYEALGKSHYVRKVVERIARLRGAKLTWAGYLAVVSSAIVLGALPTALVVRLLDLSFWKATAVYVVIASALAGASAYGTEALMWLLR